MDAGHGRGNTMITKYSRPYGSSMAGLVDFLFGPGKDGEHTDPHVTAAYDPILVGDRGDTPLGRKMLAAELDFTRAQLRPELREKFVFHMTATAAPEDGQLTDDVWCGIADSIAAHLGFGEDETTGEAARWLGVHHGRTRSGHDHIHLVASLVNEGGRKHRFPLPPGVMLNEVRQRVELEYRLRLVGHSRSRGTGS